MIKAVASAPIKAGEAYNSRWLFSIRTGFCRKTCDERGRLSPHSTSGSDSRTSRKLVNFRTLTWQSSQGESKEDSGPPTF